jgi:two-component system, chemotaxis family, protein-glutamate methylesterase/glutaminase
VQALSDVVGSLPSDLPAAVLAVLHLGTGRSALPEILSRAGRLPAEHPREGEAIRPGRVYVAPPDFHMVVRDGHLGLIRGPRENGFRPAVDVLFRSAAQSYRRRVIGVVLTGNLDDGTAGLLAVKKLGGVAVVQDPEEADYPGMPQSAVDNVPVDHVVRLAEVAPLVASLAREPVAPETAMKENEEAEVEDETVGLPGYETKGHPSGFSCPDCGGSLWEWQDGELVRYRCRIGHAYSPESLASQQSEALEAALWSAVRSLEETAAFARRLAERMRESNLPGAADRYLVRAGAAERHAGTLREMLATSPLKTGGAVEAVAGQRSRPTLSLIQE